MEEGVWSEQARPKYKDGTTANSKYITGAFAEYDLSKGEFPITTLRPIAIKSAIKEVFWIYQDQTNAFFHDFSDIFFKNSVCFCHDFPLYSMSHLTLATYIETTLLL